MRALWVKQHIHRVGTHDGARGKAFARGGNQVIRLCRGRGTGSGLGGGVGLGAGQQCERQRGTEGDGAVAGMGKECSFQVRSFRRNAVVVNQHSPV